MGYRHYFYKVPISEVEKVKDMTYDEVFNYAKLSKVRDIEEYEQRKWFYFNDNNFLNKQKVFEFGKLYYEDTDERIYKTGKPLFSNKETAEHFSDYYPYVIGKKGLLEAIEIYKNKIISYYKELADKTKDIKFTEGEIITKEQVEAFYLLKEDLEDKLHWIGRIDIDESSMKLCDSWLYEYEIYNLLFLLKKIDWNKDTLLFYGW